MMIFLASLTYLTTVMVMIRQDFDVGDLVEVTALVQLPSGRSLVGVITESQLINRNMAPNLKGTKWHKDEYHCKIQTTAGETKWVRAKWLKIISKAEKNKLTN